MAEKKGSVFEYYKEKQSQDNVQIAKCKFCTTSIKGKIDVFQLCYTSKGKVKRL